MKLRLRLQWQTPRLNFRRVIRPLRTRLDMYDKRISRSLYITHATVRTMAKRKRAATDDEDATLKAKTEIANTDSAEGAGDPETDDILIKNVNKMPTRQFQRQYVNSSLLTYTFKSSYVDQRVALDFKASRDLSKEDLSSCFNLIEKTSRAAYEPSSFGWHPKRKRREMLEKEMKYLLVREPAASVDEKSADLREAGPVVGFLSFMMTHDSTPSVPVLYVYEVHLEEHLRRTGLGSHLMAVAESIAEKVGVEKVMLTCFLSNEKALNFYGRRGYEKDVCSPEDRQTRNKIVKVDYAIMSKGVKRKETDDTSVGAERNKNGLLGAIQDWTSKLAGKHVRNGEDVAQLRGWL